MSGCGQGGELTEGAPPPAAPAGPASDYPMVIGDPFTIDGVTYKPEDKLSYDAVGRASVWLDGGDAIAAAHKTLPLPSYVEVTALDSGKTVLVRIERRGPMRNGELIELSPGAAMQLGLLGDAKSAVRVRRVNPPEPERAALRSGQRAPLRMDTPKGLLAALVRKLEVQEAGSLTAASTAASTVASVGPEPAASPSPAAKPIAIAAETAPVPAATPAPPVPSAMPSVASLGLPPASPPAPDVPHAAPAAPLPARNRPAPSTPATSAGSGNLVVQVASFASRENADRAAARLGGSVEPAGRFYRVRLGRFAGQGDAAAALAKARSAGYSDARIQRAN